MQNLLEETTAITNSSDSSLGGYDVLPVIEAILFAAARDITLEEISAGLGIPDKAKVKRYVKQLIDLYQSRVSGLLIRETLAGTYVMSPRADLMTRITVFTQGDLLDQSELRTLALIAYKQPITRADLRKLRSNTPKHLPKLMDLEFVRIDLSNEVEFLSTTAKFADYFSLSPDATDIKEILGAFLDSPESG